MNLKREKGKLYYYDEQSEKMAWYDINEGHFYNDSRQYTALPPFIASSYYRKSQNYRGVWELSMESYLFLLAAQCTALDHSNRTHSQIICQLLDRLLNVLPTERTLYIPLFTSFTENIIKLALEDKHFFTYLIKYINEQWNGADNFDCCLNRAYEKYTLQGYKLCDDNYHGANCLQNTNVVAAMVKCAKYHHKCIDIDTISYYLTHGLYDRWAYDWFQNKTIYNLRQDLDTILNMCQDMQYRPPKDKWANVDLAVRKMYRQYLENKDKVPLNLNPALAYHNDKFSVIVPDTILDYRKEADQQENCVYSVYANRVLRGETQVVFVRKNNDLQHSFITCEVRMNGRIEQYLLAHNNRVKFDSEEEQFRHEYQDYLYKLFRE